MDEYELQEAWEQDPAATAASVVDAVVSQRVNQVMEQHIAPALQQAQADRWQRNTSEAMAAVKEKYRGTKSPGGFDASLYEPQLHQYVQAHPHEFPVALVDDAQQLAEKLESTLLGQRAKWDGDWAAREMAAIKAASPTPYLDAAYARDVGRTS